MGETALRRPIQRTFEWEIAAPAARVWRAFANPGRLVELVGLPEAIYAAPGPSRGTQGRAVPGLVFPLMRQWVEQPTEWIENRWLHVNRQAGKGLLRLFDWTIALDETPSGCRVRHTLSLEPSGALSALLVAALCLPRLEKVLSLGRESLELWCKGRLDHPFPRPRALPRRVQDILADRAMRADGSEYGHGQVSRLARWITNAQWVDLDPIRPLDLAINWGQNADSTLEVLLAAEAADILERRWVMTCSACGSTVVDKERLADLPPSQPCGSCRATVQPDLASNVEIAFAIARGLGGFPRRGYVADRIGQRPNFLARVALGARKRLTTRWTGTSGSVRVRIADTNAEATVSLLKPGKPMALQISRGRIETSTRTDDHDVLEMVNRDAEQHIVEITQSSATQPGYPARRALLLQAFRSIGRPESPIKERPFSLGPVAVLATDLAGHALRYRKNGSPEAFKAVSELLEVITEVVRSCGGSVQSRVGEKVVAVFPDAGAAFAAARHLATVPTDPEGLPFVGCIDFGPGRFVRHKTGSVFQGDPAERAMRALAVIARGNLGLTDDAASQPAVIRLAQGLESEEVKLGVTTLRLIRFLERNESKPEGDHSVSAA